MIFSAIVRAIITPYTRDCSCWSQIVLRHLQVCLDYCLVNIRLPSVFTFLIFVYSTQPLCSTNNLLPNPASRASSYWLVWRN